MHHQPGENFKKLYMQELCQNLGYRMLLTERTNNRGDGLACFVSKGVEVIDYRSIHFYDAGDRVGLLLRLRVKEPEPDDLGTGDSCEVLLVNTHILFPHNSHSTRIRLREIVKAMGYVDKASGREA